MSVHVKESYFWTQIKAGLEDEGTHLTRVENDAGVGVFDITACSEGVEAWIELKIVHSGRLHFRNSQRSWGIRRWEVGGRTLILARNDDSTPSTMLLYDANDVFRCINKPSKDGKSFSINLSAMPEPLFQCNKPFNWRQLRLKIFGRTDYKSVNPQ